MEFLSNIGPFVLAVIAVIINGVPQLLYAQARGFALKPTGFAYLVGAFGNLLTGSVTPISGQAETITVASVKKNLRNNVSSILLATRLLKPSFPVPPAHRGPLSAAWCSCSLPVS